MSLFDVFCDFDLNTTNAWTLVQLYNLQQKISFRRLSFIVDNSVNAISPRWDAYRLPKLRMKPIQDDSSQFRMTCNYDTDGVVYHDYFQIAKDQLNILTFKNSGSCILVERIDIRGESCENCTAIFYGMSNEALHTDSYSSSRAGCEFKPTGALSCGGKGEDNFGVYVCVIPDHRCSSSQLSTTQAWLGGN